MTGAVKILETVEVDAELVELVAALARFNLLRSDWTGLDVFDGVQIGASISTDSFLSRCCLTMISQIC